MKGGPELLEAWQSARDPELMEVKTADIYSRHGLSRWFIRIGCGLKLRGTGFESQPCQMFQFVRVVQIK